MIGIILSTGGYMTLHNCVTSVQSVTVDIRALLITAILAVSMLGIAP